MKQASTIETRQAGSPSFTSAWVWVAATVALTLSAGCDSNPTPHPQNPDARVQDVSIAGPEGDRNDPELPNDDYTGGADAADAQPPWANVGCDAADADGEVDGAQPGDVGPLDLDGFDGEVGPHADGRDDGDDDDDDGEGCGGGARDDGAGFGSAPASEVGGRGSAR